MPKRKCKEDLTGQRFGKLSVIEKNGEKGCFYTWKCRCDCGKEKIVSSKELLWGGATSCGCQRYEYRRTHPSFLTKNSRLYGVWNNMKYRCNSNKGKAYDYYKKKGVKVCEEWMDFNKFYAWAMENGYDQNAEKGACTLDRIDVNGDYCPENCRWITIQEQQRNKTDNHYITAGGETKTMAEWAEEKGLAYNTMSNRVYKGFDSETAVNMPTDTKRHYIVIDGEKKTVTEWSKISGISVPAIIGRLNKGMDERSAVFGKKMDSARRHITVNGETKTVQEWSEITGIKKGTILSRIDVCGYTPEKAITKPVGRWNK